MAFNNIPSLFESKNVFVRKYQPLPNENQQISTTADPLSTEGDIYDAWAVLDSQLTQTFTIHEDSEISVSFSGNFRVFADDAPNAVSIFIAIYVDGTRADVSVRQTKNANGDDEIRQMHTKLQTVLSSGTHTITMYAYSNYDGAPMWMGGSLNTKLISLKTAEKA